MNDKHTYDYDQEHNCSIKYNEDMEQGKNLKNVQNLNITDAENRSTQKVTETKNNINSHMETSGTDSNKKVKQSINFEESKAQKYQTELNQEKSEKMEKDEKSPQSELNKDIEQKNIIKSNQFSDNSGLRWVTEMNFIPKKVVNSNENEEEKNEKKNNVSNINNVDDEKCNEINEYKNDKVNCDGNEKKDVIVEGNQNEIDFSDCGGAVKEKNIVNENEKEKEKESENINNNTISENNEKPMSVSDQNEGEEKPMSVSEDANENNKAIDNSPQIESNNFIQNDNNNDNYNIQIQNNDINLQNDNNNIQNENDNNHIQNEYDNNIEDNNHVSETDDIGYDLTASNTQLINNNNNNIFNTEDIVNDQQDENNNENNNNLNDTFDYDFDNLIQEGYTDDCLQGNMILPYTNK